MHCVLPDTYFRTVVCGVQIQPQPPPQPSFFSCTKENQFDKNYCSGPSDAQGRNCWDLAPFSVVVLFHKRVLINHRLRIPAEGREVRHTSSSLV